MRLVAGIAGIGPGVRLLDVGTGSGGAVAIPAALRGAEVVEFFRSTNHADDGTLAADYEYLETIGRVDGA